MCIERDTKVVQPLLVRAIPASPSTYEEGQQAIQGEGWNRGMLEQCDNGCCYMAHLVASGLGVESDGERPSFCLQVKERSDRRLMN